MELSLHFIELRYKRNVFFSLANVYFVFQAPQNYSHTQRNPHVYYRHEVINQLQQQHSLVTLVSDNLATYTVKAQALVKLQSAEHSKLKFQVQ